MEMAEIIRLEQKEIFTQFVFSKEICVMSNYPKYGQVKSLETMKPYHIKLGGRWFWIKSLEDIHKAFDYQDKIDRIKSYRNKAKRKE